MWGKVSDFTANLRKPKSQLETDLKEATSNKNWGAPNTVLQGIAIQSANPDDCQLILQHVWTVLSDKSDKNWRAIQKTLALVETLILHGSDMIIEDIRRELWRIHNWKMHRVMEAGKEVGGGIRGKATTIVDLLGDSELLQQERSKAMALSAKMTSMGTTSRSNISSFAFL
eukprot:TRINITY_DN4390_c6_g1_i2.p1 TRINITY_DN4390_c6_g1~~TRINITY_DN4390_c6_g1_i2.p1  ORF type:complete len:198 (-),score=26.44 TRINITY_DN4390_c6_g1_i2:59-571(-)